MIDSTRVSSKKVSLTALAVVASALLAACGGTVAEVTPTTTTAADFQGTPSESGTPGINLELPNLTITAYQRADELGGEEVTLAELVGHGKPVVLNFWAALCPPCRAEMPDIQAVYDKRGHEVTII